MNVRFRWRYASPFSACNGAMRISAVLLIGTMVLISDCLAVFAEEPVGTIKITRRSVAEGVGLSWGDGVLSFGGRDYAFTFEARGLMRGVDPRIAATELAGEVFNLSKPEDFTGNYQKVEAEEADRAGTQVTIRNQNGVVVNLNSTVKGRRFNLGADGLEIQLRK